jgi:hypothetical protein
LPQSPAPVLDVSASLVVPALLLLSASVVESVVEVELSEPPSLLLLLSSPLPAESDEQATTRKKSAKWGDLWVLYKTSSGQGVERPLLYGGAGPGLAGNRPTDQRLDSAASLSR